jgi:very-short-patch-repair endonuclease
VRHTILITSLRSHELAGVNPENRGAVALRNFIAYAEQGAALPTEPAAVMDAETNDFEDAVAEILRERGFHVDQQVGASAYRIDLAVRDQRDPRRYLLGVECDGATYHGSRTARDRDLLRQEVLRDQGWRLYRVWSTEWFRDREAALAKLLRAIEQAREAPVENSVPAQPARPVTLTTGREHDPEGATGRAPTDAPVERRFPPGEPYRKCRASGRRDILLERDSAGDLVNQIVLVAEAEGPIHQEIMLERLKELNGVDRAGANIQRNVERAIGVAVSRGRLVQTSDGFLGVGSQARVFRLPGDGVTRSLAQIAAEEIELAVLHKVEDQFGYQRDALPRVVADLLGFDRLPPGGAEIVGTAVDRLVERKILTVSGPYVYVT